VECALREAQEPQKLRPLFKSNTDSNKASSTEIFGMNKFDLKILILLTSQNRPLLNVFELNNKGFNIFPIFLPFLYRLFSVRMELLLLFIEQSDVPRVFDKVLFEVILKLELL
jgi:hypothetical protein